VEDMLVGVVEGVKGVISAMSPKQRTAPTPQQKGRTATAAAKPEIARTGRRRE